MPLQETKGAVVGIYADVSGTQTLVAARRDLELTESTDTRETTTTQAGAWKTFRPGAQDWTASLSHLLLIDDASGETEASQKALIDAKRNRNIIAIQVQYPGGSKDEGDAIVEELTTSAGYDEMATVDVSLQGTGPLTRS